MTNVRLRLARVDDACAIGVLARRVMRRWILPEQPEEVAVLLLAGMTAKSIRKKIGAGQRFHLAFVDDALAGVAAIRDDSHVFQLFVGTRYQGRGIARRLWHRVMRDSIRRAGTRFFTLNAAIGAVPVYLSLGFEPNGLAKPLASKVVSVPMIYRVGAAPHARHRHER
jgi:GNAT superfamily N-acetyltransferase